MNPAASQQDWADSEVKTGTVQRSWMEVVARRLKDLDSIRLEEMDAAAIDVSVLSLSSPGIEGIRDAASAVDAAKRVNEFLAERVAASNGRFEAFASVPLQNVDAASDELRRAVRDLGLRGVLVNGYVDVTEDADPHYLDEARFDSFWEALAEIDVPLYLHPRASAQPVLDTLYRDHPELVDATWGFAPETATHALRLVYGGVFDRHPNVGVILGHLGETLPFFAGRIQHEYEYNPLGTTTAKRLEDYLAENLWVTTSGNFNDQALITALLTVGVDRILFAVDYPFEVSQDAARWIESAPIGESNRRKICWDNAARLLKLGNESSNPSGGRSDV